MCKLLYPFVDKVEEKWLKRDYLEVVPVTLIERLQEDEFESFLQKLQKLQSLSSRAVQFIISLSNGNFRVGPYFSFSADMLVDCFDIKILEESVKAIKDLPLTVVKHEEFEFENANYFEYNKVVFLFPLIINGAVEVENYPTCSDKLCNKITHTICVIVYRHFQVIAFTMNEEQSPFTPETDKKIKLLYKMFLQIFNGATPNSLFFPVYQTYVKGYKSLDVKKLIKMFPENYITKMRRIPKDNLLAFLKKKWTYKNRFVFENKVSEERIKSVVEQMISFEDEEGICLAFMIDRIVTVDNFDMTLKELDPDCYKSTADYCYYNEEELKQFFEMVNNTQKDFLPFEITCFGYIKFMDAVEISPATFLMIKNTKKLLKVILYLCDLSDFIFETCKRSLQIKNLVGSKTWLIAIAKSLNPQLENLKESLFDLIIFTCLPESLLTTTKPKKVLQVLLWLRNNNIKIKISFDNLNVTLDRCCFSIGILERIVEDHTLLLIKSLLENLQNIKLIKGSGHIFITKDFYFRIFDYENYVCQDSYWEEKVTKHEDVKKCFEIFEQYEVKNAVVHENRAFLINNAFAIDVEDLVNKICPTSYKIFFQIIDDFQEFNKQTETDFPDNMLCLTADSNISKLLCQSEKLKPFETNKNIETYLQLSIVINDMLQKTPNNLLSAKWLKLLPREMLMDSESATKLLKTLKFVKNKYDVYSNNGGLISVGCAQLHISQWLQVRIIDKNLKDLLKNLDSFEYDYNSRKRKWGLNTNGSFSFKTREENSLSDSVPNDLTNKNVVEDLLTIGKTKGESLPVTLNSETSIMLGSFIWGYSEELNIIKKENFFDMVCLFEKVMEQERKDNMRSIYALTQKSKFDSKMAVKMAKTINKNLEKFHHDLICNTNLRIIPTDLWKKCNERSETYEETINLFEMLKNNKINWLIKLDGTIQLHDCITVTITHLLVFYSRVANSTNPAHSLKNLIEKITKYTELSLVCKEAAKYYMNHNCFMTQISSHKKIVNTFQNLKNAEMFKNLRMEPNGTFFVNDHIWIKADDKYMDEIPELSEIINEVFPNKIHNKFQFGDPRTSILTSVFTTSNYQLYQYCYNLCMLIEEAYPKIDIKYLHESDKFRFNDLFSIHPRSFFHLQNMDEAMAVTEKYADFKATHPEFLKGPNVSEEEKSFCKELWKIKKKERMEFDVMRETFLQQLGKLIWKNKEDLEEIGNIKDVLDNKELYHGIEKIQIQDEFVFHNGYANGFLTINNNGNIKIEFHEKYIIDALKFAANVEYEHKCCNLSDFLSLVESVKAYEKFKNYRQECKRTDLPEEVEKKSRYDQIKWWLTQISEIQANTSRKYKFMNSLKGLHHWFKHPQTFEDLTNYYDKMADFFETVYSSFFVKLKQFNLILAQGTKSHRRKV